MADPNKTGKTTTEYVLSWAAIGVGVLMNVLAALPQDNHWVQVVGMIAGAAVAVLGTLGYQVPRASLKKEQVKASAALEAAKLGKP
jgi:hypothetical protein